MFYYFYQFRDVFFFFNIFKYITFRAAMAAVTSFVLCVLCAPVVTRLFQQWRIREHARRDDCPGLAAFHDSKQGIPTRGGVFIIGSVLLSVFMWADILNRYVLLTFFSCLYLAVLGFVDDYIKLRHNDHKGLRPKTKLLWQILLGCFIGSYVFFNHDTMPKIATQLDIPFLKSLAVSLGFFYVPFIALVVIGTSNAVNLTDGLDGLAIGSVMIVSAALAVLTYITGHYNFSQYLFIPFVSGVGELTIFCSAMTGASLGFLWFNAPPATIFMGDTGSLSLGGTIGVIAVFIKKEILLILLGGIFVAEALSVILQVASYKLTGKRILRMSPLHHHFQKCGWEESKIVVRFWIIGIILAVLTLASLKVR